MIFTIGITLAVIMFAILTSMVLYYLPLMTIDTRKLWVVNLLLLGLRQFMALIQPVVAKLTHENTDSLFKVINYGISVLIAVWFMLYIHKRYSKEYKEKYRETQS